MRDRSLQSSLTSKPAEFGLSSCRSQQRPFLPPCTPRPLAGQQKPFSPQNQVTFLPGYVMTLGEFGLGHTYRNPAPQSWGGRGAIKLSQQCLPCRTISSFGAAKDSLPASGPAAESCELLLRRSFVVHSLHKQ